MSLLVLSANDVDTIIAQTDPTDLVHLMARVFSATQTQRTSHDVQIPHRLTLDLPQHTALFMPSRLGSAGGSAIKVVCVPKGNDSTGGLPATTLVLDERTGGVRAVVNARSLTAVRTAAGSALAVSLIGPTRPVNLVLFGAGLQVYHHASLLLKLHPSLRTCTIINRSQNARLQSVIHTLSKAHPSATITGLSSSSSPSSPDQIQHAVRAASIIVSATSSTTPLYPSSWVSPGTCIVLVGSYKPSMHEVPAALIRRAGKVVVDSREACLAEAGELIGAGLGGEDLVELGELVDAEGRGLPDGREKFKRAAGGGQEADVTIFKSVGIGVQDVAIAGLVVEQAELIGLGTKIDYDIP